MKKRNILFAVLLVVIGCLLISCEPEVQYVDVPTYPVQHYSGVATDGTDVETKYWTISFDGNSGVVDPALTVLAVNKGYEGIRNDDEVDDEYEDNDSYVDFTADYENLITRTGYKLSALVAQGSSKTYTYAIGQETDPVIEVKEGTVSEYLNAIEFLPEEDLVFYAQWSLDVTKLDGKVIFAIDTNYSEDGSYRYNFFVEAVDEDREGQKDLLKVLPVFENSDENEKLVIGWKYAEGTDEGRVIEGMPVIYGYNYNDGGAYCDVYVYCPEAVDGLKWSDGEETKVFPELSIDPPIKKIETKEAVELTTDCNLDTGLDNYLYFVNLQQSTGPDFINTKYLTDSDTPITIWDYVKDVNDAEEEKEVGYTWFVPGEKEAYLLGQYDDSLVFWCSAEDATEVTTGPLSGHYALGSHAFIVNAGKFESVARYVAQSTVLVTTLDPVQDPA